MGAGADGGPGKDCVVLMLGLRLECEIAAFSSFATTGFMMSFLCSDGEAWGLDTIWSCCGCATLRRESRKRFASSGVQKYRSSVCILYMYFPLLFGSGTGRCHCDKSCCGLDPALPFWLRKLSIVRVNRHGCLYDCSILTESKSVQQPRSA